MTRSRSLQRGPSDDPAHRRRMPGRQGYLEVDHQRPRPRGRGVANHCEPTGGGRPPRKATVHKIVRALDANNVAIIGDGKSSGAVLRRGGLDLQGVLAEGSSLSVRSAAEVRRVGELLMYSPTRSNRPRSGQSPGPKSAVDGDSNCPQTCQRPLTRLSGHPGGLLSGTPTTTGKRRAVVGRLDCPGADIPRVC